MNEHNHGGAGQEEARGYGGDAGQEAGGAGGRWGPSGNGAPMGSGQSGMGPGGPGMGQGGAGMGAYGHHAAYGPGVPPHAGHAFYGAPGGHPPYGPHTAASEPGMAETMAQLSGSSGLSSFGRLLGTGDSEFWKGALIGAAAVLLLTNESVQRTLFRTGAKASEAVKSGVEKVRKTAREERQKVKEEHADE